MAPTNCIQKGLHEGFTRVRQSVKTMATLSASTEIHMSQDTVCQTRGTNQKYQDTGFFQGLSSMSALAFRKRTKHNKAF